MVYNLAVAILVILLLIIPDVSFELLKLALV